MSDWPTFSHTLNYTSELKEMHIFLDHVISYII